MVIANWLVPLDAHDGDDRDDHDDANADQNCQHHHHDVNDFRALFSTNFDNKMLIIIWFLNKILYNW